MPKTGGRVKGTPNKITTTAREWLASLIDDNRQQIEHDIKQLEPKERLCVLEKLMQYVIPKQQAVSASIEMERLTDEQLENLITELTKDLN